MAIIEKILYGQGLKINKHDSLSYNSSTVGL